MLSVGISLGICACPVDISSSVVPTPPPGCAFSRAEYRGGGGGCDCLVIKLSCNNDAVDIAYLDYESRARPSRFPAGQ